MMASTCEEGLVVITPVRNEGGYLDHHIQSVVGQTLRPTEWIIVNDGSTDNTANIVDEWANRRSWIKALHRPDRGYRQSGGGVMEAFYDGYRSLTTTNWQYLIKLDGDLTLPVDYFENCLEEFKKDQHLGIGGGVVCEQDAGTPEEGPRFHVRGATKMYRRQCWDALGGLIVSPGWDTVDELKARFLGWDTRTFAGLKVFHWRPTGAADGTWKNAVKNGRANYASAYHPLFMMAKCLRRGIGKRRGIEAIGLLYGFMSGYVHGLPQIEDRALIRYIRKQQLLRLCLRNSIWS